MKNIINFRIFYLLITLISIATILSALYIEHVLNIKPCKLCLYQRYPYLLAIFLGFLGYCFFNNRILTVLIILNFSVSFLLGVYHTGIENNIFPEFKGCTTAGMDLLDKDELLNSLNIIIPNCKDVAFKLFGLSLATINAFISLFIIFITIYLLKNEKNK